MSHGLPSTATSTENHLGWLGCVINAINRWIMRLGMLALLAAAAILTYSVFSRYFFKASSDWQDEAAIFCLVGATFLCGAYVQAKRGHIGIEALAGVLPPWVNRIRLLFIDIFSALFCIFSRGNLGRFGMRHGQKVRPRLRLGLRRYGFLTR